MTEEEMKQKKEADAKEAAAKEAAAKESAAKEGDPGAVDAQASQDKSGDAASDQSMFKKMIADHLGPEHVDNEEAMAMAKESYGVAKESGMPVEEAMKCAGSAMKMSALMGASKAKKEAAAKETAAKESAAKEAAAKEAAGVKESAAGNTANTKLIAENAALKAKIREHDLKAHLDKILKESKLSTKVTKAFREQIAPRLKTEKELDAELKTFRETFEEMESGRDEGSEDGFGACVEKITHNMSTSEPGTSDGFGDCLN